MVCDFSKLDVPLRKRILWRLYKYFFKKFKNSNFERKNFSFHRQDWEASNSKKIPFLSLQLLRDFGFNFSIFQNIVEARKTLAYSCFRVMHFSYKSQEFYLAIHGCFLKMALFQIWREARKCRFCSPYCRHN